MEYVLIATGHNQAANLARFKVDPWCPRIITGLFRISLSNVVVEDGDRSVALFWAPKVPAAIKIDALSRTGLTSAVYANVTVRLPSNKARTTYANYNGIAFHDEADEYERRGSGFQILIFDLEAI